MFLILEVRYFFFSVRLRLRSTAVATAHGGPPPVMHTHKIQRHAVKYA